MSMFITSVAKNDDNFQLLADGCYDAVVVGLRGFVGKKYQSDEPEDKAQLVFQVKAPDGVLHYLTTKPMLAKIRPKSNLFKVISEMTGATIEQFPANFDLRTIVNAQAPVQCQLVVKTVAGIKDPTRTFNEIAGFLKPKANVQYVQDQAAPGWLINNLKESYWLPGIAFSAPQAQSTEPAQPAAPAQSQFMPPKPPTTPVSFAEFQANAARTPDEIPVAPFPTQPGPAQSAPSPYVAPQPKQAPTDSDSDLPF